MFHIDLDRSTARVVKLGGGEATVSEREAALDVAEDAFASAITNAGGSVTVLHPRPRP